MILIKRSQHFIEMIAVPVEKFPTCVWPSCLIIRQNVNMATSALLHCGPTSIRAPAARDVRFNGTT